MTTVLIADDEADHRELLTLALRRTGYDVVTAADAPEALLVLAAGGIDAALVDVRMPGESGIDLCRRIRDNPVTEFLPIMVISADVHRQQIMTALHAGADDYLSKPYSRTELLTRLAALMRHTDTAAIRSTAVARAAMLSVLQSVPPVPAPQRIEELTPVRRIA